MLPPHVEEHASSKNVHAVLVAIDGLAVLRYGFKDGGLPSWDKLSFRTGGSVIRMSRNSILLIALLAFMVLLSACAEDPVNPPPSNAPRIPTQGLLAFYPFNGDALDASGNDRNATIPEEGTIVDKFLTIGNNNLDHAVLPVEIFYSRGDFTLSVWGRISTLHTDGKANNTVISVATGSDYNWMYLLYETATSTWVLHIRGGTDARFASATISDLDWHHIVVLRNRSFARFYMDNEEIGDGLQINNVAIDVDDGGCVIGQEQDGVGTNFDVNQSWAGDLDNLRIYNRALSDSEINALYKETGWGG